MNPRASRSSSRALCSLLPGLWTLGALVLGGCATAPARPPTAASVPAAAPTPAVCADAADCRAALQASSREPTVECEVHERVELARRACDRDVAEGCTDLGRWWARGAVEGGADLAAAAALFQRGCALGDGEGCAWRALMTLRGQGEARDVAAGRAGLQAACDQRPGVACGLAVEGLVEAAQQEARTPEWEWLALYMHRGCDAGDGLSCRQLGDTFLAGRGVEPEPDKALALYTRACELGSSGACRLLVLETLQTRGEGLDEAGRRGRYRQACDRGAAVGCLALYDELRQEPPALVPPLALPRLLQRACQLGDTRACEFLEEVSEKAQPLCASGSASAGGVLGVLSQVTVSDSARCPASHR